MRTLLWAATVGGVLTASGCGLFNTEFEPVQKGQRVPVDVESAKVSVDSGNVPLPTAGTNGDITPDAVPSGAVTGPSGVSGDSGVSMNTGTEGPSPTGVGAAPVATTSPTAEGHGSSGVSGTTPSVPDPVVATVPHLPATAPDYVPPESATTVQTQNYQEFCQATAGLSRVGERLIDPEPALDIADYRSLFNAAVKYILLVRDSYPNADRSIFGPIIDAANEGAAIVQAATSTAAGAEIARSVNAQGAPVYRQIFATQSALCTNTTG